MLPLSEILRTDWGIDVTTQSLLQEGNGRRITRVESPRGSFVAKELTTGETQGARELAASLTVLQALAGQGFLHAPRLVPTKAGANLHIADRAVYVMSAVDGTPPPREPQHQHELGRIARALNDITGVRHRRPAIADVIADLMQRDDRLQLGPEYGHIINSLRVLQDQPLVLVHGEINQANARLTPDGTIVLLDWDDVGLGVRWLDAGYPLIQTYLAEDLTFDALGAQAYYRGYTAGAGFTLDEWELVFTAAVLHALRYLPWGDTKARWRRLLHAVEHQQDLIQVANP